MKCKECITYPICKNQILEHIRVFRKGEKDDGDEYMKATFSNEGLIYDAYVIFIEGKCSAIKEKLIEEAKKYDDLYIGTASDIITECLNIKKEEYESL